MAQATEPAAAQPGFFARLFRPAPPPPQTERAIEFPKVVQPGEETKFCTNKVVTAKYNVITFLPKNLFEQFRRVANFYFLVMLVLQLIPSIGAAVPLIIVLGATGVKDLYEDAKRHRADRHINLAKAEVLQAHGFRQLHWEALRVGDVVRLHADENVPADIVVISSSNEDGSVLMETRNLDGETNLKTCLSAKESKHLRDDAQLHGTPMKLHAAPPTVDMYQFAGTLAVGSSAPVPLSIQSLLLRGAVVRTTEWVIGVVVYTGADTKIVLNGGATPSKRTRIEKQLNGQIFRIFVIQTIAAALVSMGTSIWRHTGSRRLFLDAGPADLVAFLTFWTMLVITQNLVPIALYASLEVVKLAQAYFIHEDEEMAHPLSKCMTRSWNLSDDLGQIEYVFSDKTGTLTSNEMKFRQCSIGGIPFGRIVEPTGPGGRDVPISHSEEGIAIRKSDRPNGEIEKSASARLPGPVSDLSGPPPGRSPGRLRRIQSDLGGTGAATTWALGLSLARGAHPRPDALRFADEKFTFVDLDLPPVLVETAQSDAFDPDLVDWQSGRPLAFFTRHYMRTLSLAHSAVVKVVEQGDGKPGKLQFNASSPDEVALLEAASNFGYVFLSRARSECTAELEGRQERVAILQELAFTSDRKRMSVILRLADGSIYLYTKGADSVVMQMLDPRNNAEIVSATASHIDSFAQAGLRTLALGFRKVPEAEYAAWAVRFEAASSLLQDREAAVAAVCAEIERDLILLGATAIEDQLQVGVPEAIEKLLVAGMHVWMLTGDKLETAINIARSCRLFPEIASDEEIESSIVTITGNDKERVQYQLADALATIKATQLARTAHAGLDAKAPPHDGAPASHGQETSPERGDSLAEVVQPASSTENLTLRTGHEKYFLVIDGAALTWALEPPLSDLFVSVSSQCGSVICCRVAPLQKARVVSLVQGSGIVTGLCLAIGDGANDVSMIQTAHIGVGITGKEGRQAVMAADYAIARFRFLARLLLVHGRWSYTRTAQMTLTFFFKNFVFVFPMIWYQASNGASAQMVYHFSYQMLYNLLFTALAPVIVAVFDQELADTTLMREPRLYKDGIVSGSFNRRLLWINIIDGIWQGSMCYMMSVLATQRHESGGSPQGYAEGVYDLGTYICAAVVACANLTIGLQTKQWIWLTHVVIWGSIVLFFLYHLFVGLIVAPNANFTYDIYGSFQNIFSLARFWFSVLLAVVTALAPRVILTYRRDNYRPSDQTIYRERELGYL